MNLTNKTKLYFFYSLILFISIILSFILIQPAFSNDTADVTDKNIKQLLQSFEFQQSNDSLDDINNFNKALKAFCQSLKADDEAALSLNKWNDYLIEITDFSNKSHVKAMQIQQTAYSNVLAAIEKRINQQKSNEKEYSSSWIDDLTNRFGQDYIKEHQYSVKSSLRAIFASNVTHTKELKDLIYAEAMLLGSYKQYYELFLSFYNEKLDKISQKKMEPRKNLA